MTTQPGFLGTGASLASDISLLAYILLIVPSMLVGFVFARRKMFEPHHKLTMTGITLVNWGIILWLMLNSYREGVMPYLNANTLGEPSMVLPTIHLVTGAMAQLLASYLVFRMWFEKVLPKWIMVKKIKVYMRFTLALWLVTAVLGITIYLVWYVRPVRAGDVTEPISTPEVTPDTDGLSDDWGSITFSGVSSTPEVTPEATATRTPRIVSTPEVTAEISAQRLVVTTPEVVRTPEVIRTPEVDDDDNSGMGSSDDDDDDDDDNSGMGS